jgi:uncharacterized protein
VKVKLSDIPEEGLELTELFDPVERDLQTQQLSFTSPVRVTALFHKERDTVLVAVNTDGAMDLACDRCLNRFHEKHQGHFDLDYSVKNKVTLDVTDDIRQEIMLSYPLRHICREDCRGLCPRCGANLNEGLCEHASAEA